MGTYAVYRKDTGRIRTVGYCPDGVEKLQASGEGEGVLIGHNLEQTGELWYVVNDGVVTKRPKLNPLTVTLAIRADGVDVARIAPLANGTQVVIPEIDFFGTVDDGEFTFSTVFCGKYTVRLLPFPHLPAEYIIDACHA